MLWRTNTWTSERKSLFLVLTLNALGVVIQTRKVLISKPTLLVLIIVFIWKVGSIYCFAMQIKTYFKLKNAFFPMPNRNSDNSIYFLFHVCAKAFSKATLPFHNNQSLYNKIRCLNIAMLMAQAISHQNFIDPDIIPHVWRTLSIFPMKESK